MTSISSDLKRYTSKFSKLTMQKLRSRRERGVMPSFSWRDWVETLPFLVTFRSYEREFFAPDLASGLAEVTTVSYTHLTLPTKA